MTGRSSELAMFHTFALSPPLWAQHAVYLRRSAELLWQPLQKMYDLYLLLHEMPAGTRLDSLPGFEDEAGRHAYAYNLVAGAALETMLKAAAIQRTLNDQGIDGVLSKTRTELQSWLTNHRLRPLCARALVTLDPGQLRNLDRFQRFTVWAGRYPTQKRFEEPADEVSLNYTSSSGDRYSFEQLFALADGAYRSAREQCSDSERGGG